MIILNRAVAASGSSKADNIFPIVVDGDFRGRKGGEDDEWLAAILAFTSLDNGAADNPFGMPDAAVEAPSAADAVSAGFAHRATGGKEGNGRRRDMSVDKHPIEPRLRKKYTERSNSGGADHGAPAAGEIVICDCLQDHHLGHRIGFGAAHHLRQLEAKQAGISQGRDCLRRERCDFLALSTRCLQDWSNSLDVREQGLTFGLLLLGRLSQHFSSLHRIWFRASGSLRQHAQTRQLGYQSFMNNIQLSTRFLS